MKNSQILEKIENLIDLMDYNTATVTIVTDNKTHTLEKDKKLKRMGF